MIKLGTNSIGTIYFGTNKIGKAYLGSNLVFQSGGSPTPPLPYTPVEYIETDGTAYINTGIKGNAPMSAEGVVLPVAVSVGRHLLGCRKDSGDTRFTFLTILTSNNAGFAYYAGTSAGVTVSNSITNKTPFRFKSVLHSGVNSISVIQKGETSYKSESLTYNTTLTNNIDIYLFSYNNQGTAGARQAGIRFYEVKIYSDASFGTLVWNGVPCYYNGEYGMWDTVSKSFFGNAAESGAFTGPAIN